jgi:hypothetical protein
MSTVIERSRTRVRMGWLVERRSLTVVITAALVAIYLIWWVSYAEIHQHARYRQLAPGAAVNTKGLTLRLDRVVIADQLLDESGDEPPAAAVPGAVWVVAQFQVSQRDPNESCCEFLLVGTDGSTWSDTYPSVSRAVGSFFSSDFAPYRFEETYEVLARVANHLAGVAVQDLTSPAPMPVLRPSG